MSTERRALVLGASGGIGESICKKLAHEGWSVYLHYNNGEIAANVLQQSLAKQYPSAEFICVQADFSQRGAADQLASKLVMFVRLLLRMVSR